jgi:hypothetical protein
MRSSTQPSNRVSESVAARKSELQARINEVSAMSAAVARSPSTDRGVKARETNKRMRRWYSPSVGYMRWPTSRAKGRRKCPSCRTRAAQYRARGDRGQGFRRTLPEHDGGAGERIRRQGALFVPLRAGCRAGHQSRWRSNRTNDSPSRLQYERHCCRAIKPKFGKHRLSLCRRFQRNDTY